MKAVKYVIICLLILFIIGCTKEVEEKVEEGVEPTLEQPAPVVQEVVEVVIEVDLTSDKIMDPNKIEIEKGTIVKWTNREEKFYHNLIIYSADVKIVSLKDIIVQSGNINPGESWEYVFEESGEYIVKDIYSGTMRGEITAEVISDLEKIEVIGRISVV